MRECESERREGETCISMLADWDVLMLQECFRKLDGVTVGAHELFTPSELLGGLRCPAVIVNQK